MNTVFHLLRHADHGHVGRILTGRVGDVPLSDLGRAQAKALSETMARRRPDGLFSSPQRRARETAELISQSRLSIEMSEDLDEIDFGHWSGQAFAVLEQDTAWNRWNSHRDTARTPGGETMRDVTARLVSLIDRLRQDRPDGSFALVSHSDVIKAGICHYLGMPFQEVHRFEISPASITTLVVGDWGGMVLGLNKPAHLEPEETVH